MAGRAGTTQGVRDVGTCLQVRRAGRLVRHSSDDAIHRVVETAAKTLRHIDWFEVIETRGHVKDGKVAHFQVTVKVGFRLEG